MAHRSILFLACAAVAAADVIGHTDILKSAPQPRWKREPRKTTEDVEPIVTTGLITKTLQLCADLFDTAWDVMVEDHLKRFDSGVVVAGKVAIPTTNVLATTLAEKAGMKPQLELATNHVSSVKVTLAAHHATAWDAVSKQIAVLDSFASMAVSKFEAFMPEYKGLIPKNSLDLAMFTVYMLFVFVVLFRLMRFALRIVKGIFCGLFCCGLCRRRKAAPVSKGVAKKKEAAQAKSATPTPAPAPAAKKGKK